jgi:predicted RNase H-like HicB family nuclease
VVLDLIVQNTDDGFTAEIPSINGCETWAHKEDDVIVNAVDLLRFYLNIPQEIEIKIDKARVSKNKTIYKLVFEK